MTFGFFSPTAGARAIGALTALLSIMASPLPLKAQPAPAEGDRTVRVTQTTTPRALREPADGEPHCEQVEIGAAHLQAQRSLVYVTAAGGASLGFAVHSPEYVIAPFAVVERGRAVAVSRGSERRQAAIVAVDEENGLAVLRLELPLRGLEPFPMHKGSVGHGTPVLALGRTFEGDEPVLSVTPGVITSVSKQRWTTNALVSFHATYGAPLLDCDGDVIGVASSWWGDQITPAQAVQDLLDTSERGEPYEGGWSLAHGSVGMLVQVAPDEAWLGLNAGTALIGYDRWQLPLRLGVLGLVGPQNDDSAIRDDWVRLQAETGLGYRVLLSSGEVTSYLVPSVGVVASYDLRKRHHTVTEITRSDCSPANPCEAETKTTTTRLADRYRVAPTVGVGLLVDPVELSYEAQIDVAEPARTVHQINLGAQF